jgi:hypothetical protein
VIASTPRSMAAPRSSLIAATAPRVAWIRRVTPGRRWSRRSCSVCCGRPRSGCRG